MDTNLLILLVLLGIAVLMAAQGYGFIMRGRELLQPEQRAQSGAHAVYAGLGLLFFGFLTGVVAVVLMLTNR